MEIIETTSKQLYALINELEAYRKQYQQLEFDAKILNNRYVELLKQDEAMKNRFQEKYEAVLQDNLDLMVQLDKLERKWKEGTFRSYIEPNFFHHNFS